MSRKEDLLKKIADNQPKTQGVVAVFAQKEVIIAALEQGHSIRTIHKTLVEENLMPIQYSAFARLVGKYLKEKTDTTNEDTKKESTRKPGIYDPDLSDVDKNLL